MASPDEKARRLAAQYARGHEVRLLVALLLFSVGCYYTIAQPVHSVPVEAAGAILCMLALIQWNLLLKLHLMATYVQRLEGTSGTPPGGKG